MCHYSDSQLTRVLLIVRSSSCLIVVTAHTRRKHGLSSSALRSARSSNWRNPRYDWFVRCRIPNSEWTNKHHLGTCDQCVTGMTSRYVISYQVPGASRHAAICYEASPRAPQASSFHLLNRTRVNCTWYFGTYTDILACMYNIRWWIFYWYTTHILPGTASSS